MPIPISTSSSTISTSPSNSNLTLPTNPILKSIAQIPAPNLDTDTCALLGPFALAIQGLMACIVLGSLLVKRHREKPKRKYRIWTADVSKQVIGQAFVHSLNILISASIASLPSKGNPCALYFMNIFIDTTLGVFILLTILRFLTHLLSILLRLPPASMGLASGTYPRPFLISWLKQLGLYLIALALLKLTVLAMFYVGGETLIRFGDRVIEAVSPNAKVQVVIVVMVGPTILNVLQFLLIDSFIRHTPAPVHELIESDEEEVDGSYRGSSDEDEDLDRDRSDLEEDSSEQVGLLPSQAYTLTHHDHPYRKDENGD
ncbi:vacuolar membrane protein-domain-containing protein [Melampsora americana]|nr:vacuolar membrane protein-domain-containing protein [Melampsora americana]